MVWYSHTNRDAWAPFRELSRLQDRLFAHAAPRRRTSAHPPLQLWTGDQGVHVRALVPGVKPEELDVQVEGRVLTLVAEPAAAEAGEEERTVRRERTPAGFRRSLRLPFEVASDRVEARLRDGLLELDLPRAEASGPQRIPIQTPNQ